MPAAGPICDLPIPAAEHLHLGRSAGYLLEGKAAENLEPFLDDLANALGLDGVTADRLQLLVTTMHPEVAALSAVWRRGEPVEVLRRPWSGLSTPAFHTSPIARLHAGTHRVIRRRLCQSDCPEDFAIVDDLRQQGYTDYLIFALGSRPGRRINGFSCATRAPGGFTDHQLHVMMSLQPLLALVMDAWTDHRVSNTLLRTYLGDDAGERVLNGQVQRGQGEDIPAVIAFCDLRNFTGLSDTLPQSDLLALLDDTFDAVVTAIHAHGGEVLKFIGDAVLAVFRAQPGDTPAVCQRARNAADDILARIDAKNIERLPRGDVPIAVGISLHVGNVHYGNIGGPSRLDFTVVGPAVNIASRLQSLCASLMAPIVMTEAFARHLSLPGEDKGLHTLRGVAEPVWVFAARPAS